MGNAWKPIKRLSHQAFLLVIHKAEERIMEAEQPMDEHMWITFVSYMLLTYVIALRGNEGLMLEMKGLRNQL